VFSIRRAPPLFFFAPRPQLHFALAFQLIGSSRSSLTSHQQPEIPRSSLCPPPAAGRRSADSSVLDPPEARPLEQEIQQLDHIGRTFSRHRDNRPALIGPEVLRTR